jgi:hypothetical protein
VTVEEGIGVPAIAYEEAKGRYDGTTGESMEQSTLSSREEGAAEDKAGNPIADSEYGIRQFRAQQPETSDIGGPSPDRLCDRKETGCLSRGTGGYGRVDKNLRSRFQRLGIRARVLTPREWMALPRSAGTMPVARDVNRPAEGSRTEPRPRKAKWEPARKGATLEDGPSGNRSARHPEYGGERSGHGPFGQG